MKREILRTASIVQGRTEMSESEMRQFLRALGYKGGGKGHSLEIRLDSEVYDDDDGGRSYLVNWRVKAE